ncbi:MAG: hypothetical protein FJ304_12330 [Planctomycetes bacterium]|nr:hypothetical protein [Planctomycetota bacterium]
MRVLAGAIGVVSLAVTVAVAQERAAVFKAPEAIRPGDVPTVARGAGESFSPTPGFGSTPVANAKSAGARPAGDVSWMSGVDPNLIPAAGTASKANTVRPLTPPTGLPKDDGAQPKVLDRIKGAVLGNDKSAPPKELPHQLGTPAQQQRPQQQPTAASPFRGTGANGAPVFAGPPAYRWYGWGTVTPGANPLAPAGQYPRASANWYQITGATPGAFPVPVSNGAPIILGSDPPSYGLAQSRPAPQPVVPVGTQPTYTPPVYQEQPRYTPPPAPSKFLPGPPPVPSVPTMSAPTALPKPVASAPVVPAPVVDPKPQPVVTLPPLPPVPALPDPPAPVTVAVVPSVVPSVLPTVEAPSAPKPLDTTPPTLPPSITETPPRPEQNWTQPTQPARPAPGTWSPAADAQPLPTVSPDDQVSRAPGKPIVARGQANENNADPLATMIKQVCQGRADGVEVRYTGTKKMQMCFEIRGATEAQKLVNDISKRPELAAYQIDFCVLVK